MQGAVWGALLRHIPRDQHNQYMLVTHAGIEIAIQSFLRVEADFVILKGRLSGSQEAGRVFVLPYHNIDFLGSAKPMTESDFTDTFASLVLPEAAPAAPTAVADVDAEALPPVAPSRSAQGVVPAIRSEILERFRSNRPASSANLPLPPLPPRPAPA